VCANGVSPSCLPVVHTDRQQSASASRSIRHPGWWEDPLFTRGHRPHDVLFTITRDSFGLTSKFAMLHQAPAPAGRTVLRSLRLMEAFDGQAH
jgi:hypothetical protein